MDPLTAVALGALQGVTEWLPVSSSGHLVAAQSFFNVAPGVLFDVMLHVGTLLAVIAVFWKDIIQLFTKNHKWLAYLIAASVPIAIAGFLLHDQIEAMFSSVTTVGIALLCTGLILFMTRNANGRQSIGWKNSLLVGVSQALALVPGISRSGITMSTAMIAGVTREQAARFSFLLSIPAVLGAAAFELIGTPIGTIEWAPTLIGLLTATIVGFLSIKLLLNVIKKGKFWLFAIYCWALGLLLLLA